MDRARPNFLIAGAARCGTSALAQILAQHPDIFVSDPKEVHFYAHAGAPATYAGPGDDIMMNDRIVTDPDAFLDLFEPGRASARRGDGSVSTLVRPDVSIPNIERHAEADTRVVVMLREPVVRAHSSYLYLRGRGHETINTFERALGAEEERASTGHHHMWLYATLSRYREQLEPFARAFGDRLHVVVLEEYKRDGEAITAALCRHLDVDDGFRFDLSNEINRGGEPRSVALVKAMNVARSIPIVQYGVKRLTSASLRERIRAGNLVRPTLDERLARSLAPRFAEDVAYVEELLGRRVDAWHR